MAKNQSTPSSNKPVAASPQPKPSMPLPGSPPSSSHPPSSQQADTTSPPQPISSPPVSSPPSPTPKPTSKPTSKPPAPIKKSPFRFIIPVVIFLILLGAGFFAVTRLLPLFTSSSTSESQETTQIVYWGLWEPVQVMKPIIDEFESKNPNIKVTYEQKSHQDYRERLQNTLNDGNGPDLFRFHNTWVPMLKESLATVPSDIISTGDYEQTFYPIAYEWLRSRKGLVGVPLMIDGLGLFYNKEVLSAAGKSPPQTWDELRRTAKQVTIKQDETILRGGVALGTTSNVEHWSDIVGLMLLQNSADPKKPNNRQGQDAITFYTLYNTVDHTWDDTMPESTLAFATEKVVMMIAPSWRAHDVNNINPELDFAIAPAPKLPDIDITWASFWAEGVSGKSSSKEQDAAWKFIAFLANKETMRKFYQNASDTPGRLFGEPFSRVDLADQLSGDPLVGAYINQMPTAKSWFLASRTWDNGINDKIIKYYEDAINLVLDGEDVDQALIATEQGIAQVYSQFGL